jgi:hypothetical protein
MSKDLIGAEVVPQRGKAVAAANAFQKLGFKVLHIGKTSVSVQGSESLWRENFPVTFELRSKQQYPLSKGSKVSYKRPAQDPVPVPVGLSELIASVAFVEPPELH